MEHPTVQVTSLRKAYGAFVAVDDVSFAVEPGEIFGVLGPNGAGKTTILECLEGLRRPSGGTARVMGLDPAREPRRLRDAIGVQLQTSGLPATMRVEEAMRFFCAYHGIGPRLDLIERLGLSAKAHAQYGDLSTGQQRRLALALAVAHDPPVVFLDEPTAGLDVASRTELHEIMAELKSSGTSLVLATHDMAEAEKLADRVAILLHGKLVTIGTPRQITAAGATATRVSVRTEIGSLGEGRGSFPYVSHRTEKEGYQVFFTDRPGPLVVAILGHIEASGDDLIDLRVERPSLEERFLELTKAGAA